MSCTAAASRSASGAVRSTRPRASTSGDGSNALAIAASMRSFLVGKTRKIVPSATPAASAISRVLTSVPCSRTSGRGAATSASRRSSGGSAAARPETGGMRGSILLSEPSLTPGTRRIHVEGVFGSMKNYVTGNIHRGYMQFTARASQHCPDNPLLAESEEHPLHEPTQWVLGFTVLIL